MGAMPVVNIYFSDFFNVPEQALEEYGDFNISLLVDLPLFVDPFLLFNSDKPEYQALHDRIIDYLTFLRETSQGSATPKGLLRARYCFKEVKQTWLGFSVERNAGRGLGMDFAQTLSEGLANLFPGTDVRNEPITKAAHFEKLCLIKPGVGRDTISDFVTNLTKRFLLEFTQEFAEKHVTPNLRRNCAVEKVIFNYATRSWESRVFDLPWDGLDYVILTPKDLLTKDETWINKVDFYREFSEIPTAIGNEELRAQVEDYIRSVLPADPNEREKRGAFGRAAAKFPVLMDYFIRQKENNGNQAVANSSEKVKASVLLYIKQFRELPNLLEQKTAVYKHSASTSEDALRRVEYLKDVIENKGGWRIFYFDDKPLRREADLQILYRLVWYASPHDVSREVNDGRGPVDFKISQGADDKCLVEMKLASNSGLKKNLQFQAEIYQKASDAQTAFKVIIYFTAIEKAKVEAVLKEVGLGKR
jgi:hypothetical protein